MLIIWVRVMVGLFLRVLQVFCTIFRILLPTILLTSIDTFSILKKKVILINI